MTNLKFVRPLLEGGLDSIDVLTVINDYNKKKKMIVDIIEMFDAIEDDHELVTSIKQIYKLK